MTAELVTGPPCVEGTVLLEVPRRVSADLAQVSAAWLASRRSGHTRRAYAGDLDGWLRWCDSVNLDPLVARRRHVQVWVAQQQTRSAAASTTARRLASVSSWCRTLAAEDLVGVVPTLEVDRAPVDVDDSSVLGLDQAAAVALLRTAAADGPRSHALVALLLLRALRSARPWPWTCPTWSTRCAGIGWPGCRAKEVNVG